MSKPEPVALKMVCSVCGLGWEAHGPDPTTDKCVELLKAELARRPVYSNWNPQIVQGTSAIQGRAA